MKKLPIFFTIAIMLVSTISFANIILDGDESDWADVPYAVQDWVDGIEGLYPEEVGAIVTDNVDIKDVKATIRGNTLYWYLKFYGGPAMPNDAYQGKEYEGIPIHRSRGEYKLLLDLDNNVETGWKTDWYESHLTTVGYLAGQGYEGAEPIGAELWCEANIKYYYTPPHPDMGGDPDGPHPTGVSSVRYILSDWSEYDGRSDNEIVCDLMDLFVPYPDSAKALAWQGTLSAKGNSHDDVLNADSVNYWFAGHAFGEDFMEVATELEPAIDYYQRKTGQTFFNEGDVIGIAGFSETPADDWGVDLTTRGEFTCPALVERPSTMVMDGDDSDWADVPFAVQDWVDGIEGLYPEEVGAIVTDNVDIKDVKAVINLDEDAIYWMLRFYGGPAMPNDAYEGQEYEGIPIHRSRGEYKFLLDLDNNVETGWKTDWYESHLTTVGYLAGQGYEGAEPIGAELWCETNIKYYYTPPHPDMGGDPDGPHPTGVSSVRYILADFSEYDGRSDNEITFDFGKYEVSDPDSTNAVQHSGMLPNLSSQDATLATGIPEFAAHGFGYDFLETGHTVSTIRKYYINKTGQDYFKEGNVIGICGFSETPADDWGCDITTRGEVVVGTSTSVSSRVAVVEGYKLGNNYPNPFNPTTTIDYTIPVRSNVTITIYNSLGQAVRTLVDKTMTAGDHVAIWDGLNDAGQSLATGIYYYSLKADNFSQTKKMMLIK